MSRDYAVSLLSCLSFSIAKILPSLNRYSIHGVYIVIVMKYRLMTMYLDTMLGKSVYIFYLKPYQQRFIRRVRVCMGWAVQWFHSSYKQWPLIFDCMQNRLFSLLASFRIETSLSYTKVWSNHLQRYHLADIMTNITNMVWYSSCLYWVRAPLSVCIMFSQYGL